MVFAFTALVHYLEDEPHVVLGRFDGVDLCLRNGTAEVMCFKTGDVRVLWGR